MVLLRAAQEALANVRKHAGATPVLITLGLSADGVSDRDPRRRVRLRAVRRVGRGYGLAAMRGRVEESGGTVPGRQRAGSRHRVQVLIPTTGQEDS